MLRALQPEGLMRLFSSVSFLVLTLAAPALAEVVSAGSTITAVTLFPEGAEVTRRVSRCCWR